MKTLSILLFAGALLAQTQAIDFTRVLVGVDGKPLQSSDPKKTTGMTLSEAAVAGLETILDEDKQSSGTDKFKLDELAHKIYEKKSVVLTVEEIALIKTRIGKAYGPLVVGPAWRLLDPAESKDSKGK
jgi:hypothetical protein